MRKKNYKKKEKKMIFRARYIKKRFNMQENLTCDNDEKSVVTNFSFFFNIFDHKYMYVSSSSLLKDTVCIAKHPNGLHRQLIRNHR